MGEEGAAALVDTHCHLNHPRLHRRLAEVIGRARQAGVSEMIVVGYDLPSSRLAVELAAQHEGLWATVGVHPHEAGEAGSSFAEIAALARADRVVAIGETGLDFYRELSPREAQMEAFRRHLELAAEAGLPVVAHCREAEDELLKVLSEWGSVARVWHCFDGTPEQARAAAALGVWLGVGGTVTYPDSDWRRHSLAAMPADRLLLETDSPYLSPYPREGKRARDNEPGTLGIIAEAVAEARGESVAAIAAATTKNAQQVFGLGEGRR